MSRVTFLNLWLSILYSFLFVFLYNTGIVYATALTTANFRYLLVIPVVLITWILNVGFMIKAKEKKDLFTIIFKVISLIFMIVISLQLFFVPNVFITFTTSFQIFLHTCNALILVAIVTLQLISNKRNKKVDPTNNELNEEELMK